MMIWPSSDSESRFEFEGLKPNGMIFGGSFMCVGDEAEDVEPPGGKLPDGVPSEIACSFLSSTNQLEGNVSCDPTGFVEPADWPFDPDDCGFDPIGYEESDDSNNHGGRVDSS